MSDIRDIWINGVLNERSLEPGFNVSHRNLDGDDSLRIKYTEAGREKALTITWLTLPVKQPWTNTGIKVALGDFITIEASGTVSYGYPASENRTGPNGTNMASGSTSYVVMDPGVPAHALVGNVAGDANLDGKGFFVGSQFHGMVPLPNTTGKTGHLLLGFNDGAVLTDRSGYDSWGFRGDNEGTFDVVISIHLSDFENPIPHAKEVIETSRSLWTPIFRASVEGTYRIGAFFAMHGGGYLLLESPELAADLVQGGFVKLGAAIGKDLLLEIIAQSIESPDVLCERIAKATIKQGLADYGAAYSVARKYARSGSLTEEEARTFLYNRWGVGKLQAARALWNESQEYEDASPDRAAQYAVGEITSHFDRAYQLSQGIERPLPLTATATILRDVFEMLDRRQMGLASFGPYQQFREQMDKLNSERLAEARVYGTYGH